MIFCAVDKMASSLCALLFCLSLVSGNQPEGHSEHTLEPCTIRDSLDHTNHTSNCSHHGHNNHHGHHTDSAHMMHNSHTNRCHHDRHDFLAGNALLRTVLASYLKYFSTVEYPGYYKLHTETRNWFDAREVCAQEGAHLAVINSEAEAKAIQDLFGSILSVTPFYWVGFHNHNGVHVNVFNETLQKTGYLHWGKNQPRRGRGLNCGVFGVFGDGEGNEPPYSLGVGNCAAKLKFVCEQKFDIHHNNFLPSIDKNSSYTQKGLSLYKVHATKRKSWSDARDSCVEEGGHLAIVNSEEEADTIVSLLPQPASYWIGVHDQQDEGKYITVFNETLASTGFERWHPGKPNDPEGDKDCVLFMYNSLTVYGLSDFSCNTESYYICEQDVI